MFCEQSLYVVTVVQVLLNGLLVVQGPQEVVTLETHLVSDSVYVVQSDRKHVLLLISPSDVILVQGPKSPHLGVQQVRDLVS